MRLRYLPLAALAALLTSCHDDPDPKTEAVIPYDATGRYHNAPTLRAANPIMMYTQSGAVTNPTVVDRFLARRPWLAGYFSRTDVPVGNSSLTLTFRGPDRATLTVTGPTSVDSIRTALVTKAAEHLVLKQLDTLRYMVSATTPCLTRVGQLSEVLRQFKDERSCLPVSLSTGYTEACKVRPVRLLKSRAGQLYIPMFSSMVQSGTCNTAFSGQWNTFDPAVLNQLTAGDTVVVQEREIDLLR